MHIFEGMRLLPVKTLALRRPGWSVNACFLRLLFSPRPILFFRAPHPPQLFPFVIQRTLLYK